MAFFNYSTMQMTAKVVYYGPGLGGKTTNLEYIHSHTTENSRGEMVSLETETDRTLFFDLLPIDVGTIAGFRTRIQLYTVPGQVFYNTTRKLVLKGVDGVVFVADSQRPMREANLESFANLEENLRALGLTVQSIPLVLQYNKRDLADVASIEDLEGQLNTKPWKSFPASALNGEGVFETLQGICRLTLLSLKQQLEQQSGYRSGPAARVEPRRAAPKPPAVRTAEPKVAAEPDEAAAGNGRVTVNRDLLLRLARSEFERTSRVRINLQLQDEAEEVLHEVRDLEWEISRRPSLDEVLLRLNIALNPKD